MDGTMLAKIINFQKRIKTKIEFSDMMVFISNLEDNLDEATIDDFGFYFESGELKFRRK